MTPRSKCAVVAALVAVALAAAASAQAQDLEPRTYSNTPVGLNFLLLGYGYSTGDVAFDESSSIKDAELTVHATALAYARTFGLWGRAAKLDLVLPYAWLSGTAKVAGQPVARDVSGLGDPRLRFSVLLHGAPALTLGEFQDKQDFVVGLSLAITVPLGQYDHNRLVNIGTNRWAVRPEIGISKTVGPFTFELAPSVTFFTANHDFFGGQTLERDPLFAAQGHVIYHTRIGIWAALDATYYTGGNSTIDGERGPRMENLRVGGTLAIPVNRYNSIKLYGSTGAMARLGGNFTTVGIAWQFRWGGGL
jgi:hypothetical protein